MSGVLGEEVLKASTEDLIDEAVDIALDIKKLMEPVKKLEEKLGAVKTRITTEMIAEGLKKLAGKKGTASFIEKPLPKIDIDGLLEKHKIALSEKEDFTTVKISKYIMVRAKKQ